MEFKSLTCPNCNANIEIEDGLDIFFCKYCGHKILLSGQSKAAYDAKVRVKDMEHKERMQDKYDSQERYKLHLEQAKEKCEGLFFAMFFGIAILAFTILCVSSFIGAKKQERELQSIVDEIIVDIENEDFASARIKANSLYWENEWSSDERTRWNATRKEIMKQIDEAEEKSEQEKETSSDEGDNGFWD